MKKFIALSLLCSCCFLFLFSQDLEHTKNKQLIIYCPEAALEMDDEIIIRVMYVNNSDDTLVLPYSYMKATNFQEFIFPNKEIGGGIVSDYTIPRTNEHSDCEFENMERASYNRYLMPRDTLSISYNLNELGYQNLEGGFTIGKKYHYFVELNLPDEFKNLCSKMWVGHVISNTGSFVFK